MERSDRRDRDTFVRDLRAILELPGLNIHTRRSALYKGIQDFTNRVLKDRERQFASAESLACLVMSPRGKRHNEHVVPIGLFTDHFTGKDMSDSEIKARAGDLRRALEKILTVCWLSEAEHKRLNGKVSGLKDRMPDGKSLSDLLTIERRGTEVELQKEIFSRYRFIEPPIKVGLISPCK